jgi:hypothetical protein
MKLGTNTISTVKLGTNQVQKVYLGTNEVWSSYAYLLDDYSGAAAAYSLRKLRSAYTGSAIRVRRSSDNTEQNIGFVNNALDTSSLTSFCSGTNGFVTTWYDQSGNGYDAEQTTAANQPQIVSSGSVITENGKPTAQFDGNNHFLLTSPFPVTYSQPNTFFVIWNKLNTFSTSWIFDTNIDTRNGLQATSSLIRLNAGVNTVDYSFSPPFSNSILTSALFNTTSSELYENSILKDSGDVGTKSVGGSLGFATNVSSSNTSGGSLLYGIIQEMIFYNSNQSSNRSGIETNINNFYSIY